MKILIVEDNRGMREMIKAILYDPANEFFECDDGKHALPQYERWHPDCVLMDIEMKGMDGIKATKALKQVHPEAWVIMVTNYGDRRTREAASSAGADGFVLKENLLKIKDLVTNRKEPW
jgi:CheY-like chemotaxis protein